MTSFLYCLELSFCSLLFYLFLIFSKGPGKRGHIVADTLLPMMFLGLRKLGNICCGHKMFLNKIRNIFVSRNKCCARGQTGKHLCRQQCVRNNVSSFARALTRLYNCFPVSLWRFIPLLLQIVE